MSYIKFNNHQTDEFYLKLENEVVFSSPSRNVEFEKIQGQDGQIANGDRTLNNITRSYPFRIRAPMNVDIQTVATDVSNWLKQDALWHDLEFGGDPDYIYRAMYVSEYNIERVTSWYGKVVLTFVMKPYKFLKSSLSEITLGSTIINPTQRHARPLIKVRGTGNITIKIGQSTWTLRNVDQGVVIDTLLDTVTNLSGTAAAWDKITSYPLPTIAPGNNAVTITGNVTDIKIIPRWEVIVG